MKSIKVAILASIFLLQGCWLDSNDDASPSIGVFLDSPVRFIDYTTKNTEGEITREDQTNEEGEYEYTEGETVTFSIGTLEFPPVMASGVVTPLDIANTDNPNDTKAVNMIRLLQTLDLDGDPSNGITITEEAKAAASQVVVADPEVNVFSLPESEFEASVDTLVKNGGQEEPVTELVSTEDAVTHFEETLTDNNVTFDPVDDTPPAITVLGENPATVTQDGSYTDVGAAALDDVDGVVLVTTTGTVDTSTISTFTLTYSATDANGNSAEATRIVIVTALDTTAPEITLNGEDLITLTLNDSYTDAGATVTDDVDESVTVITSGTVDTSAIGTYTLTYSATDTAGNAAEEVTRTVNVVAVAVVDTTAPVITLSGASELTLTKGDSYTDAGATATDNIDGFVTVSTSGSVDTSIVGTYILTYTAQDDDNNIATVTRTVNVVAAAPANLLHGSWNLPQVTLHLLPDGRFLATQWADFDANDQGFEYGTYTASETELTFTTRQNHAGDILTCTEDRGTNCTGENGTEKGVWGYVVDEDSLTISPRGENFTVAFDRTRSNSASAEFEGLWESLDAKEFVLFSNGNFIYVDYLSEGGSDDIIMDIGFYEVTGNTDGVNSEINLTSNITYNDQGRAFCDDCSGTFYYDVVNKQLVVIDPLGGDNGAAGRAYFNNVFDYAPANTGRLVAQKQYSSDVLANENYSLELEDDYRTSIETTPEIGAPIDGIGNSVSVKFNVDEASNVVKSADGSTRLETRLRMAYRVPNSNDGVSVSLRFRSIEGSPAGKYVISRCIDGNCDNEVYLEGSMSGFSGDFSGDHTMSINWNEDTQAFDFAIDEKTASISISDYTQDPLVVNAGGHDFNTDQYIALRITSEVLDIQNEGESAYMNLHVDEVKFNGAVYDDFTGGLIDDRKWEYRAGER